MEVNHTKEFLSKFAKLRQDEKSSDVVFVVGKKKRRFLAHSLLLSLHSEPLYAHVSNSMAESKSREIVLQDIDGKSFKLFLDYLYTGVLEITPNTAINLYALAHRFDVTLLRDACSEYLKHGIDVDNVCSLLQQAFLFDEAKLVDDCLRFISAHPTSLLVSEHFLNISPNVMELILKTELELEEIQIFEALLRWSKANGREDQAKQLIQLIRLPSIPMKDLLTVVRSSHLVSHDDLLDALEYQVIPENFSISSISETTRKMCDLKKRRPLDKTCDDMDGEVCIFGPHSGVIVAVTSHEKDRGADNLRSESNEWVTRNYGMESVIISFDGVYRLTSFKMQNYNSKQYKLYIRSSEEENFVLVWDWSEVKPGDTTLFRRYIDTEVYAKQVKFCVINNQMRKTSWKLLNIYGKKVL